MSELLAESGDALLLEDATAGPPVEPPIEPAAARSGFLSVTNLWPPFGVAGAGVGPEAPTEDFLSALRSRLLATPSLDALTDVYLTTSPPGAVFPYLVVSPLFEASYINNTAAYYIEKPLQFDLFARGAGEAETLGQAAFAALFPRPENPPLLFTGGYEMTRFPGQASGPTAEAEGSIGGDAVYRFRFDYTFLIGVG